MNKKHDPPPVQDRPPAMVVGDEEPPPQSISAEALVAGAPAAAMLPEDLRVTVAATSSIRVLVITGLLTVLFGGLGVVKALELSVFSVIMAGIYACGAAFCAKMVWSELPVLIWGRQEYRLDEDGIVMNVLQGTDSRPRGARIRWTDIVDYKVSMDSETLHLRVEGALVSAISLRDSPPRLSTREFIRRFIVEAERHPRAPRREKSISSIIGGVGFLVLFIAGPIAEATLEVSERQKDIGFNILVVIAFGLYLWHTLDDDDVARSDRTSRTLIARLRRWLRRVLNIRVE